MPCQDVFYVCQRCTRCCQWPGDVAVTEAEITAIAAHLGMSETDFIATHTRLHSNRRGLSIIENPDHSCSMLDGTDCRIHPVKPAQCRGFPNTWNFPGWREICEAIPVPVKPRPAPPDAVTDIDRQEPPDR